MRLRNIPGAKDAIESSPYVIHEPAQIKVVGMKSLKTIIQFTLKLEWERDVF